MSAVIELLEYFGEHPTADMVLRARYLPKRQKKAAAADVKQELAELAHETGMQRQEMPAHIRELANWAQAEEQKLRGRKT